jgi:hypothetical protein
VLEKFNRPDISVTIVWIRMLPNDSIETATSAARPFTDRRVRHFYDPEKQVGKDIAGSLQWEGRIAWDIYLFYAPGQKWTNLPPPPALYSHQLTNEWADREHYRVGADLAASLKRFMAEMIDNR